LLALFPGAGQSVLPSTAFCSEYLFPCARGSGSGEAVDGVQSAARPRPGGSRATWIEERVPERGTIRASVPTKTRVPNPPSSSPRVAVPSGHSSFLVRRLPVADCELEAGAPN
jgi:hypothetical protein